MTSSSRVDGSQGDDKDPWPQKIWPHSQVSFTIGIADDAL